MRLSEKEQHFIKQITEKYIPGSKVYVFGSRADDSTRGGDIDIMIVGERKLEFLEKHEIIVAFWKEFGEQKIDLLSFTPGEKDPFYEYIAANAVEISLE